MGVRRYIFFSFILIALCGLYVFTFQDGSYLIEFFGIPITLKIAVWVVLPMALLAILSVAHLLYYNMKVYMSNRSLIKDYEVYKQTCKSALLGEEANATYKTDWFKLSNQMLALSKGKEATLRALNDEDLKKVCEDMANVEKGEYVDLKPYKLKSDNPISLKNRLNQLSVEPQIASDIVRECDGKFESELCIKAYETLIKNGSFTEIKKLNLPLKAKDVITLIKRKLDKEDNLFMEDSNLDELIRETPMDKYEYVEVARLLKREINPDTLVAMYENLYDKEHKAGKAYLYVLFEFQMIERAREVLQNAEENEFKGYKTFLFLRDNGKNTDIKHFI